MWGDRFQVNFITNKNMFSEMSSDKYVSICSWLKTDTFAFWQNKQNN